METNIQQLKCGSCGQENHRIYQRQNGEIITECIRCKSQTEIIITIPKIILRNNDGDGTLCVFE